MSEEKKVDEHIIWNEPKIWGRPKVFRVRRRQAPLRRRIQLLFREFYCLFIWDTKKRVGEI